MRFIANYIIMSKFMEKDKKFCSVRLPVEIHSLAKLEAYKSGLTLQEWMLRIIKISLNIK